MQAECSIVTEKDAAVFAKMAAHAGREMGLNPYAASEVRLAAQELAGNVVKHAGVGFGRISTEHGDATLRVNFQDYGPGIADIDESMQDGTTSMSTSLGVGLGAARRMVDRFWIYNRHSGGLSVGFEKHLPFSRYFEKPGIASWAGPQGQGNSGFFVKHFNDCSLVVVMGGAGLDESAGRSIDMLKKYLKNHYWIGMEALMEGCRKHLYEQGLAHMSMGMLMLEKGHYQYSGWKGTCLHILCPNLEMPLAGYHSGDEEAPKGADTYRLAPAQVKLCQGRLTYPCVLALGTWAGQVQSGWQGLVNYPAGNIARYLLANSINGINSAAVVVMKSL